MYSLFLKLLFRLYPDAETAHDVMSARLERLGNNRLLSGLVEKIQRVDDPRLPQQLFGVTFPNPVGLAAGMDKTGRAILGWQVLGVGHIEVGCVVPKPQTGKPKPRVFRLPKYRALINRMGFNSPGSRAVAEQLKIIRPLIRIPIGANIGKNMDTPNEDASTDYVAVVRALLTLVDYFVVNVSSPNTSGLRNLQHKDSLRKILDEISRVMEKMGCIKPVLVKISPDMTFDELYDVASVVRETGTDGIVAVNTTIERPIKDPLAVEQGGLSGPPLNATARSVVLFLRGQLPQTPIIGAGGIESFFDAIEMIKLGANMVQVFTGLVYKGPRLIPRINRGLVQSMDNIGWSWKSVHPSVRRAKSPAPGALLH